MKRSWFATASCEVLIAPSSASPLAAALSSPVLENQEGWWAIKSPKPSGLHVPPEERQSRGRSSGGSRSPGRGGIHIDKSQCGPLEG